jgi:hypothetical protein
MDRATRPWSPLTWAPALLLVPCLLGASPRELLHDAATSVEADDPEVEAQADLEKAEAMARKGQFRSAQVHYQRLAKKFPTTEAGRTAARRGAPSAFLGWDWVVENGDPENRIDVVLLGEGYQVNEMDGFVRLADDVPHFFDRNRTLGAYSAYFNWIRADLVSADNGVDGFGREYDTALNGRTLGTYAGHVGIDTKAVFDMMRELPEHDGQAIVFVRNGILGTGGGGVATIGGQSIKTAVHEFGHSFGGLGDEYATETHKRGAPRRGKNTTPDPDPAKAPWAHFIEAKVRGVGMYEGASGQVRGAFKPTSGGCLMESGEFFCPVCREAMILRIYQFVDPIDACTPAPHDRRSKEELELPVHGLTFTVTPMHPTTHKLEVEWFVLPEARTPQGPSNPDRARARGYSARGAGSTRAPGRLPILNAKPERARTLHKTGSSELTVHRKGLEPGRYRVLCRVKDTTQPRGERVPWVLKDTEGLLESERGWWIRVPEE